MNRCFVLLTMCVLLCAATLARAQRIANVFRPYSMGVFIANPGERHASLILPPASFTFSSSQIPFSAETRMTFSLPQREWGNLGVVDVLGRQLSNLRDGMLSAVQQSLYLDGSRLSAGICFARVFSSHRRATLKLVLVK